MPEKAPESLLIKHGEVKRSISANLISRYKKGNKPKQKHANNIYYTQPPAPTQVQVPSVLTQTAGNHTLCLNPPLLSLW